MSGQKALLARSCQVARGAVASRSRRALPTQRALAAALGPLAARRLPRRAPRSAPITAAASGTLLAEPPVAVTAAAAPPPPPAAAAVVPATVQALLTAAGVPAAPADARPRPTYQPQRFEEAYDIGEVLGSGTYGTVRCCTHRATGEQFAVKILARRRNKVDRTAAIENEVLMAGRVAWCPFVARTHALHADAHSVYIVQDLLPGGSLQALMDDCGALDEGEAAEVLEGVLAAIAAVHSEGICYGDVKPGNFVLASLYPSVLHMADPAAPKGRLDVRMVDFGCAQACPEESSLEGLSGTPVYMAPEVAAGDQYGPASDLWGVGVLLHYLLTGRYPYWPEDGANAFADRPTRAVLDDVAAAAVHLDTPEVAALPAGAQDLLRGLLRRSPAARLGAAEARAHPWMVAHRGAAARPQ